MTLQHLVAEAVVLGGGDLCAAEHDWKPEGGRECPRGGRCSQTVYRCARCGDYDYGKPGGPAHAECYGSAWRCDRTANNEEAG